jgi:molybdopterin-guanine dinucleotide biosynthesis protein A
MGQDKALLPLGGKPLIEHVLRRVEGLASEVLITTNRPGDYDYLGIRLVPDRQPGAGALHGLLTALEAATGTRVLVVGCDMPFLSRPLLKYLLGLNSEDRVVIPLRSGEFEPLHAVYPKSCAAPVKAAIAAGQRRMISFLASVDYLTVEGETLDRLDPEGLSFFNVNTPADLARAERLLAT